jgi:hypothetical protein
MNDSEILKDLISKLESLERSWIDEKINLPVTRLLQTAALVGSAHSGSWLGWQARVYHRDFTAPPPGHYFSSEFGNDNSMAMFGKGTKGDWLEYSQEATIKFINETAGSPNIREVVELSKESTDCFDSGKIEVESILRSLIKGGNDTYYESLLAELSELNILSKDDFIKVNMPRRTISTMDSLAANQGIWTPPHIIVEANTCELLAPKGACSLLLQIVKKVYSYFSRVNKKMEKESLIGTNVFIGHGRSFVWRDLKDFVVERMRLPYDEFNRVPVAGVTNIQRLSEMLDSAAIAFVVMSAEDEQADGKMEARTNVIHEVGLFQGRLGFTKAIVLLEEGCEEFSNIQGLGQIRFPKGNISAKFEEIRQVLEREGLIQS